MKTSFHSGLTLLTSLIFYPILAVASDFVESQSQLPIHFSIYTALFEVTEEDKNSQISCKMSGAIKPVCRFSQLANKFDTYPELKDGFYAWLRRRDASWESYDSVRTTQNSTKKELNKAQLAFDQAS